MEIDPASSPTFIIKVNSECITGTGFGPHSEKLRTQIFGLPCSLSWFYSFFSLRYSCTCFLSFSLIQLLPAQSWTNTFDLCSKDLNTSQCLRIIWGYLQKFYSKAVYTCFEIQKLCVCLGERRREWKEGMTGNEGRKAGNDSLQMKRAKHQE